MTKGTASRRPNRPNPACTGPPAPPPVLPRPDGSVRVLGQGLVRTVWTDEIAVSTRINPQAAHYTGQAEPAEMIQSGLEERKAGRLEAATAKLGRAVRLAHQPGNEETAKLLAKVVDVVDAAEGTVRLKSGVTEADEMTLETHSTKTVHVKKQSGSGIAENRGLRTEGESDGDLSCGS